MKISELRDGVKKVEVMGTIVELSNARDVNSRYTNEVFKVVTATLKDDSGTILFNVWNEDIQKVSVGDVVKIENGYVTAYRSTLTLESGKWGTLTVVGEQKVAMPQKLEGSVIQSVVSALQAYAKELDSEAKEKTKLAEDFRQMAEDLRREQQ